MKETIFFAFVVLLLNACGGKPKVETTTMGKEIPQGAPPVVSAEAFKSEIEVLKVFFASQTGKKMDKVKAAEMVAKSQQFAIAYPEDPIGGAYLFTAGEVARSLGRYEDAINIFTKVESDYPTHEKAPVALFLKGFTYEENLGNTALARKCYQGFLEKYPNHERKKEVEQLLAVVDISPEDLIKRFKEQNKQ
ncbi:MAG: TolA-binding protein [Polaribacter sp.]|jgi:TolA-binding protein